MRALDQDKTLEFLGLDNKEVTAGEAKNILRWRYGLQCARPVKKVFFPSKSGRHRLGTFYIAFSAGVLCQMAIRHCQDVAFGYWTRIDLGRPCITG